MINQSNIFVEWCNEKKKHLSVNESKQINVQLTSFLDSNKTIEKRIEIVTRNVRENKEHELIRKEIK
jgi:hypothetical protein